MPNKEQYQETENRRFLEDEAQSTPLGVHETAQVHPNARIAPDAKIREGAVIEAGAVVGSRAYIGPGVRIGKNAEIEPHVKIGARSEIGSGSKIKTDTTIQEDVTIGADCNIYGDASRGMDTTHQDVNQDNRETEMKNHEVGELFGMGLTGRTWCGKRINRMDLLAPWTNQTGTEKMTGHADGCIQCQAGKRADARRKAEKENPRNSTRHQVRTILKRGVGTTWCGRTVRRGGSDVPWRLGSEQVATIGERACKACKAAKTAAESRNLRTTG